MCRSSAPSQRSGGPRYLENATVEHGHPQVAELRAGTDGVALGASTDALCPRRWVTARRLLAPLERAFRHRRCTAGHKPDFLTIRPSGPGQECTPQCWTDRPGRPITQRSERVKHSDDSAESRSQLPSGRSGLIPCELPHSSDQSMPHLTKPSRKAKPHQMVHQINCIRHRDVTSRDTQG